MKTTTERVQAFFTFGKEAKANLYMRFAERRIVEIEALAERERNIPESVLSVMNAETDRAITLANQNGLFNKETIARLVRLTTAQKMVLARMGERASFEVKLRFQEALRLAVDAYGRAVVLRERIHKWQNMEIAPAPNEPLPVEDEVMIKPSYWLSKPERGHPGR